jgi:methionyl-tRNA synthetase
VIFVWFDALSGYLTGAGERVWQGAAERTHLIGKGILRFHAVYWPAILLSAKVALPTEILVHGYVTVEGKKIGKSLGNALDPRQLIDEVGVEALRWFLLRHIHTTKDADFSRERLLGAHDSELADQLGNLVRRSIALIERHANGVTPRAFERFAPDRLLEERASHALAEVDRGFENFAFHEAAAGALGFASAVNRYLDETAPWQLAKDGAQRERLDTVLNHLVEALRICSLLFAPFLPLTARRIAAQVGAEPPSDLSLARFHPSSSGTRVSLAAPLFPKKSASL